MFHGSASREQRETKHSDDYRLLDRRLESLPSAAPMDFSDVHKAKREGNVNSFSFGFVPIFFSSRRSNAKVLRIIYRYVLAIAVYFYDHRIVKSNHSNILLKSYKTSSTVFVDILNFFGFPKIV